jgi:hypothetical protein
VARPTSLAFIFWSIVMRGAFVIRLTRETQPAQNRLAGWVEEVDSGKELRFRSAEELLQFLGERFEAAFPNWQEDQ